MAFPSYAIAIIIIVIIITASSSVYFIFRKRKGGSVGAVEQQQQQSEEYISEKNHTSPYAVRPLMQYNNNNNNNIDTTSTLKDSQTSSTTIPSASTTPYEKTSIYENDSHNNKYILPLEDNLPQPPPPSAATDHKINLPLPPPSSSFFSDKMELDSVEANDLYASYMNVAAAQQDYVSIDLDEKPFLSKAAADISQKAATLRTNLRQSMRRKSSSGAPKVALNQFFDNASSSNSSLKSPRPESTRMSRQSSSTSSRFPRPSLQQSSIPPSPRPDSPADFFVHKFSNNSKKSLVVVPDECNSSNKTMIESIPPDSYFNLPLSPSTPSPLSMKPTIQQQQELLQRQQLESEVITMKPTIQQQQELQKQALVKKEQDDYSSMIQEINNSTQDIVSDEEEEPVSEENEDAAVAARRLIRSASRKSRTRSTLITDEAAQAMFAMIASNTPSPSEPMTVKKYATLRNHNMEIDTASIGRDNSSSTSSLDIQKWSTDDSPLSPSPKRAIMSSTMSGSATVSGKKMAKQQQQLNMFNNSSTDDLFRTDTKSATLGRKKSSETTTSGPKSLRSLFTRPLADDKSSIITSVPSIASKEQLKEPQQQQLQEEDKEEEQVKSAVPSVIDTPAPQSPITSAELSPYSSKNNTLRKMGNNVDTIRRMLQSSWSGNNLKESGSSNSLSSSDYMGSVGSSYRPVASPLGSVNPRMQNQHLVSLSLKANASQQARSRPSMPVGFMNEEEEEGPMPTASFSSSTVRTMIPADEEDIDRSRIKLKTSVMGNILGSRQQQPRQPSKLGERKAPVKKQPVGKKTPAQIEREKYLKSLET
ncbi:hypothetical protein HPULCUR_008619 [Helicostylum pulchrum]|uniref:Uncharacterized protein n=1 Tax=Helicostylum pulchrum TaxID=562976 RepID=A0ABP9Y844_9FUNG